MNILQVAVASTILVASTVAMAQDMKMDTGAADASAPKPSPDSAYSEAFAASAAKMMSSMDVKSTGDADKDFVLMMVPHHRGAIDMARVELRYGKDPVLRKLSEDIIKAQEGEIDTMTNWQAKAGR